MSEKTESFLNAMTVIGLVLVSFIILVSVILGIMFLAGSFDKHYEPLAGLKFNDTKTQVILGDNTLKLTVTANTAVVAEDGSIITDDTIDSKIKLTVRNANNVIDNSIIEVPEYVQKGEEFEIKAKKDTDGYNKGGICYISAETSDTLYRVGKPLEVKVDVPVEEVYIKAKTGDSASDTELDIENTQFIYLDTAQFDVDVVPARAIYLYGDKTQKKTINFIPEDKTKADIGFTTGIMTVKYKGDNVEISDKIETSTDSVKIIAKVQKYSDKNKDDIVSSSVTLKLYPLQLNEIQIKNPDFDDLNDKFKIQLISGGEIKISAEETGVADIYNLQVHFEPSISSSSSADTDPLSYMIDRLKLGLEFTREDESRSSIIPALDIQTANLEYNGKLVTYWTITPTRLLEKGETAYLTIDVNNSNTDAFKLTRAITVEEIRADAATFGYTSCTANIPIVGNSVSLYITKDGETKIKGQSQELIVKYSLGDTDKISFTKIVYFVTNGDDNTKTNRNEVNSEIISVNGNYQIVDVDDSKSQFTINPQGAGNVTIYPYLVRTNKQGEPIDKDYKIITFDSAKVASNPEKYVLANGFCAVNVENDMTSFTSGQYIVHQSFAALAVKVVERLSSFTFYTAQYTDDGNWDENSIVSLDKSLNMGAGTTSGSANAVTIYAVPNSPLAIADSYQTFDGSKYVMVNLKEETVVGNSPVFTDLISTVTTDSCVPSYDVIKELEGSKKYFRYLQFTLQTSNVTANTTTPSRTLSLYWKYGENIYYESSFVVVTNNVAVDSIELDPRANISYNDNMYQWTLQPKIGDCVNYEYTEFDQELEKEISHDETCYRLIYETASNDASASMAVPSASMKISEDDSKLVGVTEPTQGSMNKLLYLFKKDFVSTTNPIELDKSDIKFTDLDSLFKALNSNSLTTEQKKELWGKLGSKMSNESNQAEDYASISSNTLTIKKKLPTGATLCVFYYISYANISGYDTCFKIVDPLVVKIKYEWPEFASCVVDVENDNTKGTNAEGKTVYKLNSLHNSCSFTIASFNTAEMTYRTMSSSETMTVSVNCKFGWEPSDVITSARDGENYKFTLNNSATNNSCTITIKRSINFVIMTDVEWKNLKSNADNNQGYIKDENLINALRLAISKYDLADETVTIQVNDSSDDSLSE